MGILLAIVAGILGARRFVRRSPGSTVASDPGSFLTVKAGDETTPRWASFVEPPVASQRRGHRGLRERVRA